MQVFSMVVLIVAIACGTAVVIEYLKNRRLALRQAPLQQDLLDKVETLAERVATLEAIVTDDRYGLSRELDRLEKRA